MVHLTEEERHYYREAEHLTEEETAVCHLLCLTWSCMFSLGNYAPHLDLQLVTIAGATASVHIAEPGWLVNC